MTISSNTNKRLFFHVSSQSADYNYIVAQLFSTSASGTFCPASHEPVPSTTTAHDVVVEYMVYREVFSRSIGYSDD